MCKYHILKLKILGLFATQLDYLFWNRTKKQSMIIKFTATNSNYIITHKNIAQLKARYRNLSTD